MQLHEQLPRMSTQPRNYTEEEQENCVAYLKSMGWEHLDNRLKIIREQQAIAWNRFGASEGYQDTVDNLRMMEDLCIRARLELHDEQVGEGLNN